MTSGFLFFFVFIKFSLFLNLKEQNVSESGEDLATSEGSGMNIEEIVKLIGVFEPSFSFLLLQVIKLMTTMKRKPRWAEL